MKYLLFFVSLCFIACSSEPTCTEFQSLEWCGEAATTLKVSKNILQLENQKDGLFFVADVTFEAMAPSNILKIRENLHQEYMTYTRNDFIKKGIPFESYSERITDNKDLKYNNTELISGELYGFSDQGIYTIKYKGINENKVTRIIDLLMK